MAKYALFCLIGLFPYGWTYRAENPSLECPTSSNATRSMVLSITGHKNGTGHWVTKFSLNRMSGNSAKNWKLDIHHNITEHDGLQQLHLHGVFTENLPNDFQEGTGEISHGEDEPLRSKGKNHLRIVSRKEWNAKEPRAKSSLPHPVNIIIIRDEHIAPCSTPEECVISVQKVQDDHLQNPYGLDIDANFLIAGDGRVYEGRGWDVEADEVLKGLVVSFVGRYDIILPSPSQVEAFNLLLKEGITHGDISPDYKLKAIGELYLRGYPGKRLQEDIKKWDHWTDEQIRPFSFN